jgi:hypothetical protein
MQYSIQYKIAAILYCLGNNDLFGIEAICFSEYFWFVFGWILGYRIHRYGVLYMGDEKNNWKFIQNFCEA